MKIYLVGMPGSGKSTLGAQVAQTLNIEFIDLDKEIERREGSQVSEIFATADEHYFRKVESETLKTLAASSRDFIMATGGGTPCYHEGMDVINTSGFSIFLDEPVNVLLRRLEHKTDRPLLFESDSQKRQEQIETLRQLRMQCYQRASVVITGGSLSKILEEIQVRMRNQM